MQVTALSGRCKITLSVIVLVILFNGFLYPQKYPDTKVHELLTKGIESIIYARYDDAERIFSTLKQSHRELPLGSIYLATTEIAKAVDYKLPQNEKYIYYHLDQAEKLSQKLLEKDKTNLWYLYFVALTNGYRAYFEASSKNWLSAFSVGLNSVQGFEKCLQADSSFYEAYVAVGAYKYWRSKKTDFLFWLPFVEDEREKGVELLIKSIERKSYNVHLASNALIWVHIDREEFEKAIAVAEKALEEYPTSRIFKWGYARAVEESDPQRANEIYFDVLNSYDKQNYNRINLVILKHKIAQNYIKLGKKKDAVKLLKEILSYKDLTAFEKSRLDDRLSRAKEHLNEAMAK